MDVVKALSKNGPRQDMRMIGCTMRVEIIAYMTYSEGPEYPEYVMHFFP